MNGNPGQESSHPTIGECWALLRTAEVGRIAVTVAGRPEIFPVNFVVDHGTVVFRTAEGTKLAALAASPHLAFEADGRVAGQPDEAWSVVVKGHGEELTRLDDLVSAEGLPLAPWHAAPKGRFVRVVPHEVTGRRFPVAGPETWETPLSHVRRASPE
jgi:uncharacterized protein